jgi:hypothetical protein
MSGALLGLALIGPGSALGSTPNTYAIASGDPPVADPGATVGFTGWIANSGPSSIAQLYLSAVASDPEALTDFGGCPGSGTVADPIYCTLGQLQSGETSAVTLLAKPATTVTTMSIVFTWTFTGQTSSDGGTSHGDSVERTATVTFSSSGDSSGRFITNTDTSTVVENDQTVDFVNNRQALKVAAPGKGLSAYVIDGTGNLNNGDSCSISTATCSSLFGEWMTVGVENGATYLNPFQISITYDGKAVPKNVTAKTFKLYHNWWSDLHRTFNEEVISDTCTFSGFSAIPSNAPCLLVKKGANLVITVWTLHNGGFKGGL